jgi:hypothetical protein
MSREPMEFTHLSGRFDSRPLNVADEQRLLGLFYSEGELL